MKARLITITGIFLILLILSPFAVNAQAEGFIKGQLFNGTESGSSTARQPVILTIYLDDIDNGTRETLTDDNGMFLFEGLDTTPGYRYQVKTTFQSADYYSEELEFVEDSANLTLVLPVFDSTESDADISIMASHVIIYATEGHFHITEYYLFQNDSDRTYIGKPYSGNVSQRETLRLSLPRDADSLQIEGESMGSYIQLAPGGFIDTMPIQPGNKEVAYSYTTEYVEGVYTYIQDVFYPIGNMELLISGDVSITASEHMIRNEPFQSKGESFQHYTAIDVAPGQQMSLVLTESSPTETPVNPFWIIIIIVLLIVAAYFVYYLRSKKGVPSRQEDTDEDMEGLLNRIAGLDDDYENGIIGEDEYHELRNKYKNRLADLMENLDGD
ncbi:c-type cytochrome biogenesis protein CcmI [Chloroflexota bacterium]